MFSYSIACQLHLIAPFAVPTRKSHKTCVSPRNQLSARAGIARPQPSVFIPASALKNCIYRFPLLLLTAVQIFCSTPQDNLPTHSVSSITPATKWEYAFLSGNGTMGALFWGEPGNETVTVSHARLFLPLGANEVVPDLGAQLPELRKIIREQGYGPAVRFMMEQAKPLGYTGQIFTDPFHPGFEFQLKTSPTGKIRDYLRTENFANGEVVTRWADDHAEYQRRLFVSRADNLVVLSLTASSANGKATALVNCELAVPPVPEAQVRAWKQNRDIKGDTPEAAANVLIQNEQSVEPDRFQIHNTYKYGKGGYDAGLRIVVNGGKTQSDGKTIKITGAREVLVLMRIVPFTPIDTNSSTTLQGALITASSDYKKLLARHAAIHGELFNRVKLDLGASDAERTLTSEELFARAKSANSMPPALVEKLYDGSRYVILCATGDRPPNLQGIWSGTWQPTWSGDYTTNTNLQLAIAHQLSAGTPELLKGLFSLVDDSLPDWQLNAKNFYGARGVMAPTRESNNGKMLHWSNRFDGLFWTCGAGWLAHWYYDYYLYTGDKTFLAEKCVPLLKEVSLFYEDFLFVDDTGHYRFSPSNSAENGSRDNSTQDIMVAREVLTNLIAAYQVLGYDSMTNLIQDIERWQAMLAKLPPYLIAENGELQEWSIPGTPNKNNHRHMSHLYAIFQSNEFDPEKTPELWRASEKAYEARLKTWFRNPENVGDKKNNETASHGRMHLGLCAARFGRGEDIWEILTRMTSYGTIYPSMASAHYERGAVFNMDANGGIPEILNNALLFSQPGRLDLLPALPHALGSGEVRGLLARGQIKISRLKWSPGALEAELVSAKDQTILLRVPTAAEFKTFDAKGTKTAPTANANTSTLELKANQPVALRITW